MPIVFLQYSNKLDCLRYRLNPLQITPWNWASNWVLEMASIKKNEKVLDLGCRENPYVLREAERVEADLTLLDIQPPPSTLKLPPNIKFQKHNLTKPLPYPDASVDVILSESSLEHLPYLDRLACIVEAYRVLKPSGRLCITLGFPIGFQNDPETVQLLKTHPLFTSRWCAIYLPIDIKRILDEIGVSQACYHARSFPGYDGYDETLLTQDPNLIFDCFKDHAAVPDLARLRSVAIIEIGLCVVK